MSRPQFTLRTLLGALLVVAAFFGGRVIGIQDERKRLAAEVSAEKERLQKESAELNKLFDAGIRQVQKQIEWQKHSAADLHRLIEQERALVKNLNSRAERHHQEPAPSPNSI